MRLTDREQEVLSLVCHGQQTKTIAASLGVSQQAIKAHISRLFAKFGVENRASLIVARMAERRSDDAAASGSVLAMLRERDQQLTAHGEDLARTNLELGRQVRALSAANVELARENRQLRARRTARRARLIERRRARGSREPLR